MDRRRERAIWEEREREREERREREREERRERVVSESVVTKTKKLVLRVRLKRVVKRKGRFFRRSLQKRLARAFGEIHHRYPPLLLISFSLHFLKIK